MGSIGMCRNIKGYVGRMPKQRRVTWKASKVKWKLGLYRGFKDCDSGLSKLRSLPSTSHAAPKA